MARRIAPAVPRDVHRRSGRGPRPVADRSAGRAVGPAAGSGLRGGARRRDRPRTRLGPPPNQAAAGHRDHRGTAPDHPAGATAGRMAGSVWGDRSAPDPSGRAAPARIGCRSPVDQSGRPVGHPQRRSTAASSHQTSCSTPCLDARVQKAIRRRWLPRTTGSSWAGDPSVVSTGRRPRAGRRQPRPASTRRRQRWPSRVSSTAIP